ncbi:MAG: UDP-N-acetylmuramoyl-L-alanyl-D-glutamate--2,6-diaminopimelate ligase [Zymomonas mobilis subsp. pomaceae]|uniref:UDP-N-acetylmuramoyl-L-alanyl-D-glutamate--2,6-diaminopimelate ligase n=1 Tax=Zymomonas mobilis subsp. pomaceae (strain ATCC 29192 / DSM 22645 / JCM 10191 / CCUG 17912 / NBRC 13757 / NCIMB 11200 / NRRL B-4491 / Barker I) TaxID=579138 RepID=F8EVD3_ZYMMT|nr:UDP-N-acetylmuramoyl-L-alanyl-D-glutamate--2,6-diaminopimelate ligase [Zymomonas mobilis]AEI37340.1 UDP-N-acetylmuramyl-tripeptide synthetase [Zymomonas mobilis subsp. pomaceae ATCC 29192]MDX5948708.1 UDP-N-acetylmuramoyl-L-alanyl-D-glutamate--2,6-diaminopimelate ligase [Zymomonas mobilis subsp. pomaceae]GEB88513.1 UDP-N-acetylmuramoyl-L-alanyl-D-glutamate--2,6-diaminopimelate ligase [Zymomonas mobilis subsp. pomaceae]
MSRLEKKLGDLAPDFGLTEAEQNSLVRGCAVDNRQIQQGYIFGAFPGVKVNGEDFIPQAIAAGAVAVVARPEARIKGAIHLVSDEPRKTFAEIAARFFAPFPSVIAAVTGTNGKTSVAELCRQLWQMAGYNAASIGTFGIISPQEHLNTGMTTPDIITFLSSASKLAKENVSHLIFEASSHGLAQYRSDGPRVMAGGFTSFSRDHLDYHGTMDAYLAAKLRLFDERVASDGTAVVWADDPVSASVIAHVQKRGLKLIDVGEKGGALRLLDKKADSQGQHLSLSAQGKSYKVRLPLIGSYQVANALVAAGLVIATGGDVEKTLSNLSRLKPVRGRLERAADTVKGAAIYVDYAHTPEGLRAAIDALRPHTKGKLFVVFGAGGDRDRGKRPEMGRIAVTLADHVIVTDDNPRGEVAADIRQEILAGADGAQEIEGRKAAIFSAVQQANKGDIILIAGKGHEQGQIIGRGENMRILPFDDVTVAKEAVA